jgi:transcriptional regulator with XRE-family HTH domain
MQLANRIRKIREAYGMTQADVAYKAEISPQAYGKIERKASKTKFETLLKIANAIGVSINFLVDIESSEFTQKNNL